MIDDPTRLIDSADAPIELREALEAARTHRPSAERVDALLDRLLEDLPPDGGDDGSSGDGGTPDISPATVKIATVVGVGALAVGGYLAMRTPTVEPAPTTPVETHAPVAPPLPTASVSAVAPAPSVEPTAAPSASVAETPSPVAPAPVKPPSEEELLGKAQSSLASNPSATLAACAEHAKYYPGGTLSQEREVLIIEALVNLGRTGEAKSRAKAFRAAYPNSGHNRRLDVLVGE